MPDWVLGNNVFTLATDKWSPKQNQTIRQFPPTLSGGNPSALFHVMWQSGVVKGMNVYVDANTSSTDVDLQFYRGVYDGIGANPYTATTLLTVPAGETGYFCMDENDLTRAQRTWVKRDYLSFRWRRDLTQGGLSNITYAVCLEYIEEYLLTNDWDDTADPPILNRQVSH
jgi:hypothetical protein